MTAAGRKGLTFRSEAAVEGDNSGVPVPAHVSRRRSALVTRSVGSPGTSCISVAVLGAFIRVPIATGSVFTQSFKGEDGCGDRARAVRRPGLLGPGEARARAAAAGGERPRLREPRPVKAKRQRTDPTWALVIAGFLQQNGLFLKVIYVLENLSPNHNIFAFVFLQKT